MKDSMERLRRLVKGKLPRLTYKDINELNEERISLDEYVSRLEVIQSEMRSQKEAHEKMSAEMEEKMQQLMLLLPAVKEIAQMSRLDKVSIPKPLPPSPLRPPTLTSSEGLSDSNAGSPSPPPQKPKATNAKHHKKNGEHIPHHEPPDIHKLPRKSSMKDYSTENSDAHKHEHRIQFDN